MWKNYNASKISSAENHEKMSRVFICKNIAQQVAVEEVRKEIKPNWVKCKRFCE